MKKSTKKKDNSKKSNIIFLIFMSIILLVLIFLSFYITPKKKNNNLFTFDITELQYISPIDLEMFKASLHYQGMSIIFLCINESEQCYNEVNNLNFVAKNYQLNIEYMNILELVDKEKDELKKQDIIFNDELYPKLLIIKDNKIIDSNNEYLDYDGMINFFKKNSVI